MTIQLQFCTSDGKTFSTRRDANTHQRTLDARGMLENLLAQVFSAHGRDDDSNRDAEIATMLYTHKDAVIQLLKGKPTTSPDQSPTVLEAMAEYDPAEDDVVLTDFREMAVA